nr:MAG TPA: hypothetical protein [Caudoviricetes sp.]
MKFKFKGHIFELAETLETSAPIEIAAKVECALLQFDHPNWAGDPHKRLLWITCKKFLAILKYWNWIPTTFRKMPLSNNF